MMIPVADKNSTHLAGEYFVAAELYRRGYSVAMTLGNAKAIAGACGRQGLLDARNRQSSRHQEDRRIWTMGQDRASIDAR